MEELQGGLGDCGEVATADGGRLAAAAADHKGGARQGVGALVVVVVPGQHEIHVVATQDRFEPVAGPWSGAVPTRGVRGVVHHDDPPLVRRRRQGVGEPIPLLRCRGAEDTGHAGVEVEEVGGPMGGRVVEAWGAEQAQLSLDLGQTLVAVAQIGVMVADGELKADAGVDEGPHRAGEDVVETIFEVAVVADVAEEGDQAEGHLLVGAGHLGGHRQSLAPSAAVVTKGDERDVVVGGRPGLRGEGDVGRLARDEVLLHQEGPDVLAQDDARGGGTGGAGRGGQELAAAQRRHRRVARRRASAGTSHGPSRALPKTGSTGETDRASQEPAHDVTL